MVFVLFQVPNSGPFLSDLKKLLVLQHEGHYQINEKD